MAVTNATKIAVKPLRGDNPQIAEADGDTPVKSHIAATLGGINSAKANSLKNHLGLSEAI